MKSSFPLFRLTAATLLLLGLTCTAQAQGDPGSGGPTPGAQEPTAVPIDGGAALLLVTGVGIGLKKLRQRRPR
jgi:hypothetical protein